MVSSRFAVVTGVICLNDSLFFSNFSASSLVLRPCRLRRIRFLGYYRLVPRDSFHRLLSVVRRLVGTAGCVSRTGVGLGSGFGYWCHR